MHTNVLLSCSITLTWKSYILVLCMFQKISKNISKFVKSNRLTSITYNNNLLAFLESQLIELFIYSPYTVSLFHLFISCEWMSQEWKFLAHRVPGTYLHIWLVNSWFKIIPLNDTLSLLVSSSLLLAFGKQYGKIY